MKFESIVIRNLRAVRQFEVSDLGNFVVVAGQNGSGKSCVFDAIRLLKSVYGGHQANEYHQWFSEFAINLQDPTSLAKLFRSSDKPIEIRAHVSFADSERAYIRTNAADLAQPMSWLKVMGQPVDFWSFNRASYFSQIRNKQDELTEAGARIAAEVVQRIDDSTHEISLVIHPNGEIKTADCKPVEAAFQAYVPEHLGLIEYHSASRSYSRQAMGGIELDNRAFEDRQRQNRLYNWQNKYQNIKTELASGYLRELIAKEAGETDAGEDLNKTLQELFQTFFPDKSYEGVQPQLGGSLEFPVRLATGEVHDIDELSSGEKEILYGYLKLRNSTPPHSVILLDEPELHLNPSLLHGFADFYYRRLGLENDNQLWLVTHSDTLLRQAVGNANYRVFQMVPATAQDGPANQAAEVLADDDVERVTIQLVGDLAAYRPHGKVVVLEGDGDDGFDVTVVRRLFPDFARRVNMVSGGHKQRVRDLYDALHNAAESAGLKNRFFAVVDMDSGPVIKADATKAVFSWDVYHIENYLLHPPAIRAAVASLLRRDPFATDDDVTIELKKCAEELVDRLVMERLQRDLNAEFISAVHIKGDPGTKAPAAALSASIATSTARVADLAASLSDDELQQREAGLRATVNEALADGTWMSLYPGRSILRRFANRVLNGKIDATLFSNSVLDKLVDQGVQPAGMRSVLDQIAAT